MSDPLTTDGAAPEAAPLGFIKVEVQRCSATTKAGTPCMAPAAGGTEWCVNHRKKFEPGYVQPLSRAEIRELAVRERTAQVLARHAMEDKEERKKYGRRVRKNLIDQLAQEMELHPKHVTQIMLEGLQATRTVRRRVLNENGTEQSVYVEDGDGKMHARPVYEDIAEPDHQMRLAYSREILDRLYGRPRQRKEGEGSGDAPTVNIAVLLANAAKLEKDPAAYYAEVPGLPEPTIDVGEGELVSSDPPV